MTKEQITAVLKRVSRWPDERRHELAELALAIEAEIAAGDYRASEDELAAIDQGLSGEPADRHEVEAAFAALRRN